MLAAVGTPPRNRYDMMRGSAAVPTRLTVTWIVALVAFVLIVSLALSVAPALANSSASLRVVALVETSLLYIGVVITLAIGERAIRRRLETLEVAVQEYERSPNARLGTIVQATPDLVAMLDAEGSVLYLNAAARQIVGIGEGDDERAFNLMDRYPDWARALLREEGFPTAIRDGAWSGETAVMTAEDEEIPFSQLILAHRTPTGSIDFLSTVARDISDRKNFETQLVYLASHDGLTDLFNRRRFQEEFKRQLTQTCRAEALGALLFLDLDEFKGVNDTYGHRAGDELLVTLAGLLRNHLRDGDVLARLGGDEFAILLSETSRTRTEAMAERVLEAIRSHVFQLAGQPVGITASMGITLFSTDNKTQEELFIEADVALYQAKELRNSYCVYMPDIAALNERSAQRSWEHRLKRALEEDRFELYAQPIVPTHGGRSCHYEVLLRLIEDNGEIVMPGQFLPAAERCGLITAIDRWVVHQAIELIAREKGEAGDLRLAVNLSGRAFGDAELLPMIQRDLTASGIDPASLTFEVTESAAVADIDQARKFITTLKALGCRFAIDDFGVGFSSFYYLKHLPVDYLKIDGGFIRNLARNRVDQHLVKAIVEVARGLGKETIAEFVHDAETFRLLREYGVDYAQGYHVGQPLPVSEIGGRLRQAA